MPRPQGITKATKKKAAADERRAAKAAASFDSFNNWSINLGLGTNNALTGGTYGFNPVTRIRTLLEWMYRGSWLARVGIDQVAMDMTRGGVNLLSDAKATDIKKLENKMARLRVWPAVNRVIKWSRLYGGCLGYIQIRGADPATPLRPETVGRGLFLGIQVLDRWMVEPLLNQLVQEGPEVGLPEFYRVVGDAPGLKGRTIHHSRCIRLVGIELPYWQQVMENYWGVSIFEPLYDRMIAFDSATMGAAQLAYKCHLRTMKVKGYRQIQAAGGPLAIGFAKQMELMRQFQSIEGVTVIDAEDEVEVQTATFSGLSDVILQVAQQLSGGLKIPLTKLLGQSAAGLNATGEGDERNYNSAIKQEQDDQLKDPMHRVYRVAAVSEGIDLGDDYELEFRPLWQLSDDEMSQIEERGSRSIIAVEEAGLVSPKTALMELKARGANTNSWQTITEEDIEEADDEVAPAPGPGEMVGPDGKPIAAPAAGAPGGPAAPGAGLRKEQGGKDRRATLGAA